MTEIYMLYFMEKKICKMINFCVLSLFMIYDLTVCPRSLYSMGHYFLDRRYVMKCLKSVDEMMRCVEDPACHFNRKLHNPSNSSCFKVVSVFEKIYKTSSNAYNAAYQHRSYFYSPCSFYMMHTR